VLRIVITGANRGLGYQFTKIGLEKGNTIVAGVRVLEEGGKAFRALKERFNERLHIIQLDVTKESTLSAAAHYVRETLGGIDVIINNAGILVERDKTIEDLDMRQLIRTFEVNTFGPMRVIRNFLPLMTPSGEQQAIINISSEAGTILNAFPTNYPYSMSKTALNMFSERLREYLKERGIRVYAVHPGWMKTDMGGEEAPYDPENTANGVYNIIENKVNVYSKISFIDFNGRPMPL